MIAGRRTYPRLLVRGLVLFGVGMTAFAAVASREHNSTVSARNELLSQYVALESRNLAPSDPALAAQLALVAYRLGASVDSRSALLDTTAAEIPTRLLGPAGHTGLALGDDGHRVAISYQSTGQVKVYSLRQAQLTPLATVTLGSRTARIDSLALSRRGDLLAVGDSGGQVALWSLAEPSHPLRLAALRAGTGAVHGLSFSPGGAALAAADADGAVQRWSLTDRHHPTAAGPLAAPGRPPLQAVSYSHGGKTLSAVGRRGSLVIWPAHGGSRPLALTTAGSATLTAVTYSPDGRWIAVGGKDGFARIWRLDARGRLRAATASVPGPGAITSLAFSRDSRYLAVGASAGVARVLATSDWSRFTSLPHPAGVTSVAFSDGDRRLLSSDVAGAAIVWQFPSPSTYATGADVTGLRVTLTRPELTVSTAGGSTQRWDVVDEWRPSPATAWNAIPLSAAPTTAYWLREELARTSTATTSSATTTTSSATTTAVNAAAVSDARRQTMAMTTVTASLLSSSRQLFAAAGEDHQVYLWNVADPSRPKLVSQLAGPATTITRLALSPDGRELAVATAAGHVWLYAVGIPSRPSLLANLSAASGRLAALAFSPSDDTLVAGGAERRLTFWHFRPYQAVNRICALAGTPITPNEWATYVPQAAYRPPCAKWTPPPPPTLAGKSG